MKKILLLISFNLAFVSLFAQLKKVVQFNFDGKSREFIVSIPTTPPPPKGYPLVMMLHGTSGDMNVFYNVKGWKELGEKENFVTIFPSSLRWCFDDNGVNKVNSKFVCGDLMDVLCPSELPNIVSDIKFFRKVVQLIQDTLSIDSTRIFGSGFSNGSAAILKSAIDAGDLFKAVGGSSGPLSKLDSALPVKRIPAWFMVGSMDDRYMQSPNKSLPWGGDSILGYMRKSIERTIACQGLKNIYTKTEGIWTKSYLFNQCQQGSNCAPFVFTLVKDMTHEYANGVNHAVNAPQLFWDFFNTPPQINTASANSFVLHPQVSCFPNPSNSEIKIQFGNVGESVNVKLFATDGRLVMHKGSVQNELTLHRSDYGKGVFFLHVETESKKSVVKLMFE